MDRDNRPGSTPNWSSPYPQQFVIPQQMRHNQPPFPSFPNSIYSYNSMAQLQPPPYVATGTLNNNINRNSNTLFPMMHRQNHNHPNTSIQNNTNSYQHRIQTPQTQMQLLPPPSSTYSPQQMTTKHRNIIDLTINIQNSKSRTDSESDSEFAQFEFDSNFKKLSTLKELIDQCRKAKQLLSTDFIEENLFSYDEFQSEIEDSIREIQSEILRHIPRHIDETNIKAFVNICRADWTEITLPCLQKINKFIVNQESHVHQVVKQGIIDKLIMILKIKDIITQKRLLSWTTVVLANISCHAREAVSVMVSGPITSIILSCLQAKDVLFEVKENCTRLISNLCFKIEYRDFFLKQNLLLTIMPLCRATSYSILLLKRISKLFLNLMHNYNKLPYKKYLNVILNGMSLLIMYENDIILTNILSAYGELIKQLKNDTRVNLDYVIKGCVKPKAILKQYKQKSSDDNKLFKRSMKEYENEYDLNIPIVITGICRQYFDVFTKKKVENMDCRLYKRLINLFSYPNYGVQRKVLSVINQIVHISSESRKKLIIEFDLMKHLKKLLSCNNFIIIHKICCILKNIVRHQIKQIFKNDFIHSLLQTLTTITQCDGDILSIVLNSIIKANNSQIKSIIKINNCFELLFLPISRILSAEKASNWLQTNLRVVIAKLNRIDNGNNVKYSLLKEINKLQSKIQIEDNKTFLADVKRNIVDSK